MSDQLSLSKVHPMVIFWLGLLTGAIVVGFVFFYKFINPVDYESALYRFDKYSTGSTSLDSGLKLTDPTAPKGGITPNGFTY